MSYEASLAATVRIDLDWARNEGMEQGIQEGMAKGMEQGMAKGAKDKAVEMAKKMKDKGTDVGFISEITGLSGEEIEYLK